ncbi:hypothetical protein ACFLUZ_06940 [Chloroflexota bacterium]
MESESPESGFDELVRLSKEMNKVEEGLAKREEERARREQELAEKKEIIQSLTEIKVSVALEQLKSVATPAIIEKIDSLRHMRNTEELRDLISDLTTELEKCVGSMSGSNPDMVPFERSVKTLTILIELLFSMT